MFLNSVMQPYFKCITFFDFPGNTTSFQHHISHEHRTDPVFTKKGLHPCQPKIKTFSALANTSIVNVGRLSVNKKTELDDLLTKLIIGKVLPTSLVDNMCFKAFVGQLDPRYLCFEVSKCEYTFLS